MNINRKSLFFVQSPIQLLNAIEAKHFFNIKKCHLIIRKNGVQKNDKQLLKVLQYDDTFDKISFINIKNKFQYYKFLILFIELSKYKFEKVFVGDFYSKVVIFFIKFIQSKKIYLLDDGLQSVAIHKNCKTYNMFSYFNLSNNSLKRKVYKNNFNFLRSYSCIENRNTLDKVYFIGAPLVEKNILSISDFIVLMKQIVAYYNKLNIEIVYLPHRAENVEKLASLGINSIIQPEVPIEFYLIESVLLPSKIASFYSAALYSLKVLFRNKIEITSFYIPNECVDEVFRETLKDCYSFYETEFKVIYDLNLYND